MTLGPLERIAVALETIATALTGTTPTGLHTRPQRPDTPFEWERDLGITPVAAPLPEPVPPFERCGFTIEQYLHPLDRSTVIYQVSKDGVYGQITGHEAAMLTVMDDDQFTGALTARLAEVAAQRAGAVSGVPADAEPAEPEDDDERRQREWAAQMRASDD